MRNFWAIARREYLERIRSRWFICATGWARCFSGRSSVVPLLLAGRARPSVEVSHIVILDATRTDLRERSSTCAARWSAR